MLLTPRRRALIVPPPLVGGGGGGGAYVGPANLTGWSSPSSWWGLRAVSAAYAAALGPIADLVDQAGANPITINAKADGTMDVAAVAAWVAAHSVTTIKVSKLYDQIGTKHATQATLANMPVLALNTIGVRPGLQYTAANGTRLTATSPGLSQPFTFSGVVARTGAFGNTATIFADANIQLAFAPSVAAFQLFSGNLGPQTPANDSIFHAFSTAWNDGGGGVGTSTLYTSTDNIAASSSRSMASPGSFGMSGGCVIGENTLTGFQNELGVWPTDLSANYAAMDANQRAYWGF